MRENLIAKLLTEEYAERILVATYYKLMSVQELSEKHDIPIAACYRKIHELEKVGLIKCEKEVTSERGKPVKLYKSQLKSACILFKEGQFRVRFEIPGDDKIHGKWIELNIYIS
jgi:predicted ArsR family transcriptional regulator